MYQSKSAAEAGQAAMKDAVLVEIKRTNPVNKMLNLEYKKSPTGSFLLQLLILFSTTLRRTTTRATS